MDKQWIWMADTSNNKERIIHNGLDLPAKQGTEARSLADGKVTKVVTGDKISGNYIEVDHGQGYVSKYLHLQDNGFLVNKGNAIRNGQSIGLVGSTGRSTGPHLHLIVTHNGKEIDPSSINDLQDLVAEYSEDLKSADLQLEVNQILADAYSDRLSRLDPTDEDYQYSKDRSEEYSQKKKDAILNIILLRTYYKIMKQKEDEFKK